MVTVGDRALAVNGMATPFRIRLKSFQDNRVSRELERATVRIGKSPLSKFESRLLGEDEVTDDQTG